MQTAAHKPDFRRYLLLGFFWMAVCEVAHYGLQHMSFYRRMENANLDALLAASTAPHEDDPNGSPVFVVWITEEDFQNPELFGGISPLNPKTLARLIDAVLSTGPKAVGVDFDTALWPPESRESAAFLRKDIPVVWAKTPVHLPDPEDHTRRLNLGNEFNQATRACFGVPIYVPDEDGVVREYQDYFQTQNNRYVPSLAFNLAKVADSPDKTCQQGISAPPSKEEREPKLIGYHGASAFGHLSAGALLKFAGSKTWLADNPLRNKVVLAGGAYSEARDDHPTPLGYLAGVDILASSVRSQLRGGRLDHEPAWNTGLGYLEGIILLVALYFVPLRWSLLVTLLAGPVYGVLVNWLAFHGHAVFISFVPSLIGLIIYKSVDYAREHRRLHEENIRLTNEVERLRKTVEGSRLVSSPS